MSSVNTPLSLFQCAVRTTAQWEMAVVYCLPRKLTPKAFSTEKRGEKFPIFFFFLFFFLFFSRESKITPTVVAADVAAAISPRGYDVVANESVADAVCSYVRSQHVTGGLFAGTVYHTLFLERQPKRGHKSTNANSKSSVLKTMVVKCFFFFAQ